MVELKTKQNKNPKPNQKAKENKVRCDPTVISDITLVDFKISQRSFQFILITNVGCRTKGVPGCLKAFGGFRSVFLCDTRASSSPQCCSRCHPNRSFQRHVRFPVTAWHFRMIQQLLPPVGHSTREESQFVSSVLPVSDT